MNNEAYLKDAFQDEGRRYRIDTPLTPRAWQNVHFSGIDEPVYYALFDNHGDGSAYFRDQAGNQAFLFHHRFLYLRDNDRGTVWNVAGGPVPAQVDNYRCDFTLADSEIASSCDGVDAQWRMFTPLGKVCEVWTLTLSNRSDVPRRLSVLTSVNPDLSGFDVPFRYNKYVQKNTEIMADGHGLYLDFLNPFKPDSLYNACFVSSHRPAALGGLQHDLFDSFQNPARPNFDFPTQDGPIIGSSYYASFLMRHDLALEPGESITLNYRVGAVHDREMAAEHHRCVSDPQAIEAEREEVVAYFRQLTESFTVETGDVQIDAIMSHWVKKQINSYLAHKKAYRDNLQVDLAFAAIDPKAAADNLLDALSYQYEDGHAPHAFRPVNTIQYSDKPAWILLAVPEVIRETGDPALLEVELPFLKPDGSGQTTERATVREHLVRAMRFLAEDTGPHGINRMHHADWNDGLDGLSRNGPGESGLVTLIFLAGLRETLALAEFCGDSALQQEAAEHYATFKERANQVLWDGAWYLRGFNGLGQKVGSAECEEGQIFLNPQSWAAMAGIASDEQLASIWENVDARLESAYGMHLCDPIYSKFDENIGCMSAYLPGWGENGCYSHAGAFWIFANCRAGRAEAAWRVFRKILPGAKENPVTQSQSEPYCFTNSIATNPRIAGISGLPWRTGTSAWMFRNFHEGILGIQKDFAGLRLQPRLPAEFSTLRAERRFRGNHYRFTFDHASGRGTGIERLTVNGEDWTKPHLPLAEPGAAWEVNITV